MSASRANVRRLVGGLLVFIWAALVLGAYYAVHKPLPPAQLPGVVVTLHGLAAAAATLVVSYAVGRAAVARWFGREPAGLRLALSIGLGSGGLAIGFVLAGALQLYYPATVLTAVAAALVYVLRRRADFRALRLPRVRGALAWFVVGVSGVAFLQAAAPPTAWDALVYHLTGPELYVQAGRLVHPIDLHYLGFPQWGEALFTFGMLLGSDRAPALLHWTFAILTLVVVYETVRRILPTRGILAVALLAATPSAMLLAGIPYVDWFAMFAVALAFYALLRWGEAEERRWLALAGAGAGLAFAAKYSSAGAILGLAAGAAHLQAATRNRSFGQLARNVAAFVFPAVLVALPWLFKNLALTGNPVYPFFFDGLYWDELRRWWYSRPGTGLGGRDLLLAPWNATVLGVEGAPPFGATIGPLWLMLIPLAALGWRLRPASERRALGAAIAVAVPALAVWLVEMAWSGLLVQTRLLLPVFPVLALLAGAGFDALRTLDVAALRIQWVLRGIIGFVIVLAAVRALSGFAKTNPLPVLLGAQSSDEYRRERLGWYAVVHDHLQQFDATGRVLFLWEPRAYGCVPRCRPDALLDRWWHARQSGASAAEILADWRAEGVSHVLISEVGVEFIRLDGFDPFTEADWLALEELRGLLRAVQTYGEAYTLYEIP